VARRYREAVNDILKIFFGLDQNRFESREHNLPKIKIDFVNHMPPKWNLEDDIKIMKNLVRTGATRLTDRVPFAPQQSLDFVEERIGHLGQSGDAQRAR
jgi:hypothetical protein